MSGNGPRRRKKKSRKGRAKQSKAKQNRMPRWRIHVHLKVHSKLVVTRRSEGGAFNVVSEVSFGATHEGPLQGPSQARQVVVLELARLAYSNFALWDLLGV